MSYIVVLAGLSMTGAICLAIYYRELVRKQTMRTSQLAQKRARMARHVPEVRDSKLEKQARAIRRFGSR